MIDFFWDEEINLHRSTHCVVVKPMSLLLLAKLVNIVSDLFISDILSYSGDRLSLSTLIFSVRLEYMQEQHYNNASHFPK